MKDVPRWVQHFGTGFIENDYAELLKVLSFAYKLVVLSILAPVSSKTEMTTPTYESCKLCV